MVEIAQSLLNVFGGILVQVFILGGTGSLGTAIVAERVGRSHQVTALSRSARSDKKLALQGAQPIRGEMCAPSTWIQSAVACDAIIQVAATFGDDMAEADKIAMSALIAAAEVQAERKRMLYTGGCWLYGETGDAIATESYPFKPLKPFDWMVSHSHKLLATGTLSTAVIHPAMVYHCAGGGVFERFLKAAKAGRPIEIWGHASTRWPLIERTDLARVYGDLLERPDLTGHLNAAAEDGVAVGDIASSISKAYKSPHELIIRSLKDVVQEHGAWAKGPTLDQQMSGQKIKAALGWTPQFPDYRQTDVIAKPGGQMTFP